MTADPLARLIERLEAATGRDRDLDGDIAETVLGWKTARLGPDAHGENACEVLTPDGKLYSGGFQYPPRGKVHRAYHTRNYTSEVADAFTLAPGGLQISPPFTARRVAAAALRARHSRDG